MKKVTIITKILVNHQSVSYPLKNSLLLLFPLLFTVSCAPPADEKEDFLYPDPVQLQQVHATSEWDGGMFGSNIMVQPLENGHIVVADIQQLSLYHFDQDGNHIETIGRSGQGPGEYARFTDLIYQNNQLLVFDVRNQRVNRYSFAENRLRLTDTHDYEYSRLQNHPAALFWKVVPASDGRHTSLYYDFNMMSADNPRMAKIAAVPYNEDFTAASDTAVVVLDFSPEFEFRGGILTIPYIPRGYVATLTDYLVYASNQHSSLLFYDRDGNLVREVDIPGEMTEITRAQKEELFIRMYSHLDDHSAFRNEVINRIPDQRPTLRSLQSDADDRLWVRLFRDDSDDDWLVMNNAGSPLFTINIPDGHTFRNALGNKLYTTHSGDSGLELVVFEFE